MPHCIVEHSQDLSSAIRDTHLLKSLFDTIAASDLFGPEHIKCRSLAYDSVVLGNPQHQSFLHCRLHILEGRAEAARLALAQDINTVLKNMADAETVSVTVDIVEMDKATYIK